MVMSLMDLPSIVMSPSVGSKSLLMHFTRVDFPTPLGPMMQYRPGWSMLKVTSFSTGVDALYLKDT